MPEIGCHSVTLDGTSVLVLSPWRVGIPQVAPGSRRGPQTNRVGRVHGVTAFDTFLCALLLSCQAAPYLGTVEPSLAKDLIRRLTAASSGGFHAQAALLAAIARCDPLSNAPQGLLKVRVHAWSAAA
jgi:hypothetical protein